MKRLLFAVLALVLTDAITVQAADAFQREAVPSHPQKAPTLNLAGQVLLPDGLPAPHAVVYLSWRTEDSTIRFAPVAVDAEGRFKETKTLDSGVRNSSAYETADIGVTACLPGKATAWYQSALGSRGFADLKLRLQPGVTLTGRLVRIDGSPAANAELHAGAIFPAAPAGSPRAEQQANLFSTRFPGSVAQTMRYDFMMRLLPDKLMPTLFHAHTDAEGRFTLTGLPPQMTLLLQPDSGLALTPNSMAPLQLNANAHQEAGVLVAMQTGSARIHILNSETHRPAAGVNLNLELLEGVFFNTAFSLHPSDFEVNNTLATDRNGVVEVKNLQPGTYEVRVMGGSQEIKIEEGKAAQAEFVLRQGPLRGRLLDAGGKPLARVDIMLGASASVDFPGNPFGAEIPPNFHASRQAPFDFGWERRPITQTGADGSFVLPDFPWGSACVIVRATKRNARAEYIGPISGLGKTLELRMKPNALISVTGRLVDPHRRPVKGLSCVALHWRSSLRSTWFGSAHEVRADAQGRFRIEGVERGESFSILSNGQHTVADGQPLSRNVVSPVSDFESPRFVTGKEGAAQDLGDIMVHPSHAQEDISLSYGTASREIASSGVLEAPGPAAVTQAKATLMRYHQALRSGDVKTVHLLTSPLSANYSPQLPEYLLHAPLTGAMLEGVNSEEAWSTLRFAPRALIDRLIHFNALEGHSPVELTARQRAAIQDVSQDSSPDADSRLQTVSMQKENTPVSAGRALEAEKKWVFLTAKRKNALVLAGVLHLEAGQWRVVSNPITINLTPDSPSTFTRFVLKDPPPQAGDETKPASALPPEESVSAQKAGERYLHLWAENRPDAMLAATSRCSSSHAKDTVEFKKMQEHRPDAGLCPLSPESRVALQPLPNLTLRDQKWLLRQAHLRGTVIQSLGEKVVQVELAPAENLPQNILRQGDLALLEYASPEGRFLMALVRQEGQWKVLEPALPL